MKLNAELAFIGASNLSNIIFDVKVSQHKVDEENIGLTTKGIIDYFIEYDTNDFPVKDIDFEFNGDPYYESYKYGFIKIETLNREIALTIIEQRQTLQLILRMEKNKKLNNDITIYLNNCDIYELNKNSVILRPNDVRLLEKILE